MSSTARLVLCVVLSICLVTGGTVLAATTVAAVSVYRAGTISVAVQESGSPGMRLAVPASLVNLAVAFVPNDVYEEVAREVGPHWDIVEALSHELSECPDAVFVEVVSRDEHVKIAKERGKIIVQVESPRENVRVALPLRTFETVVQRVSRIQDRIEHRI